jgi:hypothetical protein
VHSKIRGSCVTALIGVTGVLGGLSACTPTPAAPLACTATLSSANPVQGAGVTVTIVTASGAKVVTSGAYPTGALSSTSTANAIGTARAVLPTASTVDTLVKVVVSVTKGTRSGSCATSFTTVAAPDTRPAADSNLKCADVSFPDSGSFIIAESYLIETSQSDCTEAEALASKARLVGQAGGGSFTKDGFTCTSVNRVYNLRYNCINGPDLIIFEYQIGAGTHCTAPSANVTNVTEIGTDCDTVNQLIAIPHAASPLYSSNGWLCSATGHRYLPPGFKLSMSCSNSTLPQNAIEWIES